MNEIASNPWAAVAYLVAGVFFIMALRPASASGRQGARFGMAGMAIAALTTLATHPPGRLAGNGVFVPDFTAMTGILAAIAIGAAIGLVVARRIRLAAMPQLVAILHSLVGVAAVLVAAAALRDPVAFGIADIVTPMIGEPFATIHPASRTGLALAATIGAITFSGSVVAALRLAGAIGGAPILVPMRRLIDLALLAAIVFGIVSFHASQSAVTFGAVTALSVTIGALLVLPIGRAELPVMMSMLNASAGLAAVATGIALGNGALIAAGALVGGAGVVLSHIMSRAMGRSLLRVLAGGA